MPELLCPLLRHYCAVTFNPFFLSVSVTIQYDRSDWPIAALGPIETPFDRPAWLSLHRNSKDLTPCSLQAIARLSLQKTKMNFSLQGKSSSTSYQSIDWQGEMRAKQMEFLQGFPCFYFFYPFWAVLDVTLDDLMANFPFIAFFPFQAFVMQDTRQVQLFHSLIRFLYSNGCLSVLPLKIKPLATFQSELAATRGKLAITRLANTPVLQAIFTVWW